MAEKQEATPQRSGDARQNRKRGKAGRLVLVLVVLLLVLALGGIGVYASLYEGIFPNTYIGDCDVSGMSQAEALERLNETYYQEKIQGGLLPLSYKKTRTDLSLDDLEVAFDNHASVDAAVEKSRYPNIIARTFGMAKHLFTETRIDPVLSYDEEKLENAVLSVVGEHEVEPVGYTFEIQEKQVVLHGKVNGIKAEY